MKTWLIATILLGCATTLVAQTAPSFELRSDGSYGFYVGPIVQGDFNNDGKPDVVIAGGANYDDLTLRVGNGDGTFGAAKVVGAAPSSGGGVVGLVAADMNRDGNLDLVAVYTAESFAVFYGNGDGTFQAPKIVSTASYVNTVAVGDFNGDGLPDVALGDVNGNLEIFSNEGGKNFIEASGVVFPNTTGKEIAALATGDVDANGTVDIAVLTFTSAYVLWGNGNGTFRIAQLGTYVNPPTSLSVADLNQDGYADVVVSYICGGPSSQPYKGPNTSCMGLDVFYGEAQETTRHRVAVNQPGVFGGPALAVDVNGDGIADLVAEGTTSTGASGLYVWLGRADGSFAQTGQAFITNTNGVNAVVAGDWNRDGMMDFADGSDAFFVNATNRAPCATSSISETVTVCAPVNGTYSNSPVRVQATAFDATKVTALQEYVDNKLVYSEPVTTFNTTFAEAAGQHTFVTKAWDAKGASFRSNRYVTVYNGTPGMVCAAALGSAAICLPSGATSGSPVHILANGYTAAVPTAVQLYVDGRLVIDDVAAYSGTSYLDTEQALPAGTHDLVFKMWDAGGHAYVAEKSVTVK